MFKVSPPAHISYMISGGLAPLVNRSVDNVLSRARILYCLVQSEIKFASSIFAGHRCHEFFFRACIAA